MKLVLSRYDANECESVKSKIQGTVCHCTEIPRTKLLYLFETGSHCGALVA